MRGQQVKEGFDHAAGRTLRVNVTSGHRQNLTCLGVEGDKRSLRFEQVTAGFLASTVLQAGSTPSMRTE